MTDAEDASGRMRRRTVVGLLAAAVLAIAWLAVAGRSDGPDPTPAPPGAIPAAPPGGEEAGTPEPGETPPTPVAASAVFVEVVFEISVRALPEGAPVEVPDEPRLDGFVLRKTGASLLPTLHPARGVPCEAGDATALWVGSRFVDLVAPRPIVSRTLTPAKGGRHDVVPKGSTDAEDPLAVFQPPGPLTLTRTPGNGVSATLGDWTRTLRPGETVLVAAAEQQVDLDRLAARLAGERGSAGERAALRTELQAAFDVGPPRLFTRMSVVHHGRVRVGPVDLLERLQAARTAAKEGPYEHAEDALEAVLAVLPEHAEANDLWSRVARLLDDGREAGRLTGTLVFPDGMPTGAQEALWQRTHSGFAALARPDQAEGDVLEGAPVESGRFSLPVPQGSYRLTVHVPGFVPATRVVEVGKHTTLSIVLEP